MRSRGESKAELGLATSHETKYILKSRLSNRVEARDNTPSSKGAPAAPPALDSPPPPENREMKLLPNGCGLTGANGSGVVVPPEEEEELSPSPEEGASASQPPMVPKTFAAAFTTAAVPVPTRFVRGCTAALAGAIPEEEG